MKRNIPALFPLGTYFCKNTGGVRDYPMDESLIEVLGQASKVLVQSYTYEKTDADAKATLRLYQAALDGDVREKGLEIGSGTDLSNLGPAMVTINGPFCGRIMAYLEIKDGNATPANQKRVNIEVGVTLVMEE